MHAAFDRVLAKDPGICVRVRDESIRGRLRAHHHQSIVHICPAIGQWIRDAHPKSDKTAARLGRADYLFLKSIRRHRIFTLAAKVAEEKAQRRQMDARIHGIMNRIESKRLRTTRVHHQRAGAAGLFGEP